MVWKTFFGKSAVGQRTAAKLWKEIFERLIQLHDMQPVGRNGFVSNKRSWDAVFRQLQKLQTKTAGVKYSKEQMW